MLKCTESKHEIEFIFIILNLFGHKTFCVLWIIPQDILGVCFGKCCSRYKNSFHKNQFYYPLWSIPIHIKFLKFESGRILCMAPALCHYNVFHINNVSHKLRIYMWVDLEIGKRHNSFRRLNIFLFTYLFQRHQERTSLMQREYSQSLELEWVLSSP